MQLNKFSTECTDGMAALRISRHVVKFEDPRPLTRHLIFVYCWNMENRSSGWSMTAPFDTWFIAKHGDCRLACTGDCSQKQLTAFRPSQRDSIHTDATAWLLACVPATISTICYTSHVCVVAQYAVLEANAKVHGKGQISASPPSSIFTCIGALGTPQPNRAPR